MPTVPAVNPAHDPAPAPPLAGAPTAHDPAAESFAALDRGFTYGAAADAAGFVVAPAVAVKLTAQDRAESILSTLPPSLVQTWGAVIGHADRMLSKSLVTGIRSFDVAESGGKILTYTTRREASAVVAVVKAATARLSPRLRCSALTVSARKVKDSSSFKVTFYCAAPPAPKVTVDTAALMARVSRRPAVFDSLSAVTN